MRAVGRRRVAVLVALDFEGAIVGQKGVWCRFLKGEKMWSTGGITKK